MPYLNYITGDGKAALHGMLASDRLVLTRAVGSSMTAAAPEALEVVAPENQTAVQMTAAPHGSYTEINCSFDCRTLDASYTLRMIGLYGKLYGETVDRLIYVIVVTGEDQMAAQAGSELVFNYSLRLAVGSGSLVIETNDSMSCPISHLSDNARHLLTQTNDDPSHVLVPSGTANAFADGDVFVFVPKVDVRGEATISVGGVLMPLTSTDAYGAAVANDFVRGVPVGLTYRGGSMVRRRLDETRVVSGVLHWWDGAAWRSTLRAGLMSWTFASTVPAGWLYCDGSTLAVAEWPELFEAIGHDYGGSGSSFRLPDMRGRAAFCDGGGLSRTTSGGAKEATLKEQNIPSHKHTFYHRHKMERHPFTTTQTWASSLMVPSGPLLQGVWANNKEAAMTNGPCDDTADESTKYTSKAYRDNPVAFSLMPPYMAAKCLISHGGSLIPAAGEE